MFDVTFCLCFWSLFGVFGVETDVLESVSVMEGDSVTLKNDDTEILRDDGIMWTFGPKQILIAHIKREDKNVINDAADGRFRGRIQLDQTGSLTITNTRTTDSGQYNATTKSKETLLKIFNITVYARLPVPVITTDSPHNSSSSESSSKCVLVCSVVNVTQETLSWYKGNSLFSSISVSDLNRSLSLPLECVDDSYSCVVNNPIRNQTKHLNITEVCQPCSASANTDILLIAWISAAAGILLIVLIIAVVIFCICRKCRKTDQEVQTREEEITYANPAIYQRKALKSKVKEEDDVVYAGVAVRR